MFLFNLLQFWLNDMAMTLGEVSYICSTLIEEF